MDLLLQEKSQRKPLCFLLSQPKGACGNVQVSVINRIYFVFNFCYWAVKEAVSFQCGTITTFQPRTTNYPWQLIPSAHVFQEQTYPWVRLPPAGLSALPSQQPPGEHPSYLPSTAWAAERALDARSPSDVFLLEANTLPISTSARALFAIVKQLG